MPKSGLANPTKAHLNAVTRTKARQAGSVFGLLEGGFLSGMMGGGLPGFSSSSSASSAAISSSDGMFKSGPFNPVFGSEPAATAAVRQIAPLAAVVVIGGALWLTLKQ